MSKYNYTIAEEFELPSKGLIYTKEINPKFKIRSMTTAEEMKRLSFSETPYKVMAEIIEDCLVTDLGMPVYDLCIGDFQYMLHKLRIVTYGSDYKISFKCPICGSTSNTSIDLDALKVSTYSDEIKSLMNLHLPQCDKDITLRMQSPKILDNIAKRKKEIQKKMNDNTYDPSLRLSVESLINTVDGEKLSAIDLEKFVLALPMKDVNLILQTGRKLNDSIGIDNKIDTDCEVCGRTVPIEFRITGEFFGPTID